MEYQGHGSCGPWKVQLGGPSEEGGERTAEKSSIVSQENAICYAFRLEQSSSYTLSGCSELIFAGLIFFADLDIEVTALSLLIGTSGKIRDLYQILNN